jgi:hypothetical protein
MTSHVLRFYNQSSTVTTQQDIGPFNETVNGRILKGFVHGEVSGQSANNSVPYVVAGDILWGLQWVPAGNSPLSITTSSSDDHWLWRHYLVQNTDTTSAFATPATTATVQTRHQCVETYRGQGIKPGGSIDFYLSFQSVFGINSGAVYLGGSIDLYFT